MCEQGSDICCIMHRYGKRTIWCENVKAAANAKACKVLRIPSSFIKFEIESQARRESILLLTWPATSSASTMYTLKPKPTTARPVRRTARQNSIISLARRALRCLQRHQICPRSRRASATEVPVVHARRRPRNRQNLAMKAFIYDE